MPPSQHDNKEVTSLLSRIHTGYRFVDLEDLPGGGRGKGGAKRGGRHAADGRDIANYLRNAAPPDEVHGQLGRALARSFVGSLEASGRDDGGDNAERGERILRALCCGEEGADDEGQSALRHSGGANYASAASAFFGELATYVRNGEGGGGTKKVLEGQWENWCIRCEELVLPPEGVPADHNGGGGTGVLNACLKGCVRVCFLCADDATSGGCARVYERLVHHSSRKYLIRTCVARAFKQSDGEGPTVGLADRLSPLFHSCVLRSRKGTKQTSYHEEKTLILQELLRECSAALHVEPDKAVGGIANLCEYLTASLESFLKLSVRASFVKASDGHQGESVGDVYEFGYDWLRGVCDLLTKLVSTKKNDVATHAVSKSIGIIISSILPQFAPSSMSTFDMAPIYLSLVSCIKLQPNDKPGANATVALRLGSLALNLEDDADINAVCEILLAIFGRLDDTGTSGDVFIGGILTALGCVVRCRPPCYDNATLLIKLGESIGSRSRTGGSESEIEGQGAHLTDILIRSLSGKAFQPLIDIVASSISDLAGPPSNSVSAWQRRPLSLADQSSGLLLGLSLVHTSIGSSQRVLAIEQALAFLRSFLQCYPRMSSRVVPSIVAIARECLDEQSTAPQTSLLAPLDFLASPCIVADPHGAHLAWTFIYSLVQEGVPTAVRSAVLRLLHQMCASNKRLFRRAKDAIGRSMVVQDPIIRLSATAALSEMANLDLLRDVEQIVGWIQNCLTDDEDAVVYYALQTLRYLIVNEELEFDLVIRVLEKRLGADLSNADEVRGLGALALEGLVELLGEGGLEEEDEDEEPSDGEGEGGPAVSPQSIKAVSLLVELALSSQVANEDARTMSLSNARIYSRIFGSLAGYSSQVLGLDAENIRAWNGVDAPSESEETYEDVKRFLDLRGIAMAGLSTATQLNAEASSNGDSDDLKEIAGDLLKSVTSIGKTLLQFEEETHGSFLFRGGSSSEKTPKGKTGNQTRVSKAVLSALPSAQTIQQIYQSDPRAAGAVATLYAIGSSESLLLQTEEMLLQISDCLGDIASEPLADPALALQQVCATMRAMDTVAKSLQNVDESVKEELLAQIFAQLNEWQDTVGEHACVAMASFALSLDDSAQTYSGVSDIQQTILEGRDNYLFESDDTKFLCLGMIGAKLSRTADARVAGLIDAIEESLHEPRSCFGAVFGLATILSSLQTGNINGTDPTDAWRKSTAQRIICMLLSALNTCLQQEDDDIAQLISSIENDEALDDIADFLSSVDALLVQDRCAEKMKAILIGLGHAFPVLSAISAPLFRGVFSIVDKLPWGSGKAFALQVAYTVAIDTGALQQEDILEAIADTASHVESLAPGFGDALLSLASLCRICNDKVKEESDLVATTCKKVLVGTERAGGEDRVLSILAACAAVGEFPGVGSSTPIIHAAAKKSGVAETVKMLEELASNDAEAKSRDAATIGLGLLSAMSTPSHTRRKTQKEKGSELDNVHAKDGTAMQAFLQETKQSYSILHTSPSNNDIKRVAAVSKLQALFSSLEPIAMPGSFSRVIELTLMDASSDELELKASAVRLLASQLESRRRIGFDGRGFVDLYTRLSKMPQDDLNALIGANAFHIMAKALPDLLCQIPTSAGEGVAKGVWAICVADLRSSSSCLSAAEFLVGLKRILTPVDGEERKRSISPALLRTLQKFIAKELFANLCADAVPSDQADTQSIWAAYIQCRELVPSATFLETDGPDSAVSQSNVFGMAICATTPKSARKVEAWLARQEISGDAAGRRHLLLATVVVAQQPRSDIEMKESVLSLMEIMLVKGIDTMCLPLISAKVAFWVGSRQVTQLNAIDSPLQRVSAMSSFLAARNLSFRVRELPVDVLEQMIDLFVDDLPLNLSTLAGIWKISDDVGNYASRILSAFAPEATSDVSRRGERALGCMREIARLTGGGEE